MAIVDNYARRRLDYLSEKLRCLVQEVRNIENGGGGTEVDPIFVGSPASSITSTNITNWNSVLGNYVDLTTTQANIDGSKSFLKPISVGSIANAGVVLFKNGLDGATTSRIGYVDNTTYNFRFWNQEGSLFLRAVDSQAVLWESGNFTIGAMPDNGFKLEVGGTSSLNGNVIVTGDINPTAGNYSLGNANRFNLVSASTGYFSDIRMFDANGLIFRDANGANIASLHNTGNLVLGSGADTGEMFQVNGTSVFNSTVTMLDLSIDSLFTNSISNTGFMTVGGNITLSSGTTQTYNIGSTTLGFNILYAKAINSNAAPLTLTTTTGNALTFNTSSTFVYAGFFATSKNMFLQATGTTLPTDTGERLQVYGTSKFTSTITSGGSINPTAAGTLDIGGPTLAWRAVYGRVVVSDATAQFGTIATASPIQFRQGSNTQIIGGFHLTSGNFILQTVGSALSTDTGERLQVQGTSLLNGVTTFGGSLLAASDNSYNLGSSSVRFANAFIGNIVSPGTLTINTGSSSFGLQFRQNSSTLIIGGFYGTTGNFFVQPAGTLSTDTGDKLQVGGSAWFGGNIVFDGNLTRNIGTSTNRVQTLYTGIIDANGTLRMRAGTGNSFVFSQVSDATTLMMLFGATGNLSLQGPAAIPSDTGERLQVAGNTLLNGAVQINGITSFGGLANFQRIHNGAGTRTLSVEGTLNHSTGLGYGIGINITINQTGTAGYAAYYASPFENSVGSGNKFLIDVGTNSGANNSGTHTSRFNVSNIGNVKIGGSLNITTVPVYADNAAAITGGLAVGDIYKTSTGQLMIRY